MRDAITVNLAPDHSCTKLLVTRGRHEILKGLLPPPSEAHQMAADWFLDGLALWLQQPLSVVLFADWARASHALHLCDGFGMGHRTLHYRVTVVEPEVSRRGLTLGGVGDFRALRRLSRKGVPA